jgi:PhnB protein
VFKAYGLESKFFNQKSKITEDAPMSVKPIPDGFPTVIPYLVVKDAFAQYEFLQKAFDAKELHRTNRPNGRIANLIFKIGTSVMMMGEASEEWKPMAGSFYLYVEDCDAVYKAAIAAGGTSIMEPANQFYGDRHGGVTDAAGHQWWIATHIEDVSDEEIQRRSDASENRH